MRDVSGFVVSALVEGGDGSVMGRCAWHFI